MPIARWTGACCKQALPHRRPPFCQGSEQAVSGRKRLVGSRFSTEGFEWIDSLDNQNSVLSFLRRDSERISELAVILNLTPVPRMRYRLGLPRPGKWLEVLNSDSATLRRRQSRKHGQRDFRGY
jgi:1,4-alpha-glucan branching enzyme